MQEIRSSNPPVVAKICDPNKSRARHHRSFKLGSKLRYLKIMRIFKLYIFKKKNINLTLTDLCYKEEKLPKVYFFAVNECSPNEKKKYLFFGKVC